jgi:hypothetical protein
MRVSDSERERVAQFLREQSLEGRLDHEELEDPAPIHRPQPRRRRPPHQGPHPLAIAGMVLLGLLVLPTLAAGGLAVVFAVLAAMIVAVFVLGFLFGPFILIGLLISQATRRRSRPRPRQHWSPNWR